MIETKETLENREAVGEEMLDNEQITEEHTGGDHGIKVQDDFLPLFGNDEADQFRILWLEVQSSFVDDPIGSVREADELVSDVIENIRDTFANQKILLEKQWKSGDEVSTEDLRIMLKRYHSFFDRLLALEP
jgi:hypothetical protein